MKPPIIVSGDDLYIFESAQAAESYLESPDVCSGLYTAYDSEGRLLRLWGGKPTSEKMPLFAVVDVVPIRLDEGETEPTHQEELRKVLYQYLKQTGKQGTLTSLSSLQEIMDAGVHRIGFTR